MLRVAVPVGLLACTGAVGLVLAGAGEPEDHPASLVATPPAAIAAGEPEPARRPAARAATAPVADSTPTTDRRDTAAWPRHGASAARMRVPILMYHLIAQPPAGTPYPDLWVTPAEFRAHVTALEEAGFVGVTLGEVWDAWHGEGRLPARPVVISFDDGDLSQVMNAAPVLAKAGWPGVLNLAVDHLNARGLPRWGARRMLRQGWEIDSHTISHADLTTLGGQQLRRELQGSREELRRRLGIEARFFCYPAGRNDATVRAAVRAAGYEAATTVEPGVAGRADDPMLLPRIRVQPGSSGALVVAQARA